MSYSKCSNISGIKVHNFCANKGFCIQN